MKRMPPDYNGFTQKERLDGWEVQKTAKRRGELKYPRTCEMCGLTYEQHRACITPHVEDYRRMIENVKPLCVECHERLHRRFLQPNTWIDYLLKLRTGYQPPAWTNYMQFRAANSDLDLRVRPDFTPDPEKWWELLRLTEIDLRAGGGPVTLTTPTSTAQIDLFPRR